MLNKDDNVTIIMFMNILVIVMSVIKMLVKKILVMNILVPVVKMSVKKKIEIALHLCRPSVIIRRNLYEK